MQGSPENLVRQCQGREGRTPGKEKEAQDVDGLLTYSRRPGRSAPGRCDGNFRGRFQRQHRPGLQHQGPAPLAELRVQREVMATRSSTQLLPGHGTNVTLESALRSLPIRSIRKRKHNASRCEERWVFGFARSGRLADRNQLDWLRAFAMPDNDWPDRPTPDRYA